MGKSAVIFLIVGLAIGLWLGFNPTSHRELVRSWRSATTGQVREQNSSVHNLRQLDTTVGRWLRSSGRSRADTETQPSTATASRQISAAWNSFWNALENIWLNIAAKFRTAL